MFRAGEDRGEDLLDAEVAGDREDGLGALVVPFGVEGGGAVVGDPPAGEGARGLLDIGFGVPVALAQGAEMGRFLLGSTVVLLFPRDFGDTPLRFNPAWAPGRPIRMGEAMAA